MYNKNDQKFKLVSVFAAILIIGLVIFIPALSDNMALAKGMTDFNDMTEADFVKGRFVQGTIYELYDEFAYEEEYESTFGVKHNERVSAHYYIMPLYATYESETMQYVAVCIKNSGDAATAQKMLEETWDYWDTGAEPAVWTELPITGKVTELDGELLDYFYEWLMYGDNTATRADYEAYVCPYIIEAYYNTDGISVMLIIGGIISAIGLVGLAVAITVLVKSKKNGAEIAAADEFPVSAGSFAANNGGYTPVNNTQSSTAASGNTSLNMSSSSMESIEPIPQTNNEEDKKDSGLGVGIDD